MASGPIREYTKHHAVRLCIAGDVMMAEAKELKVEIKKIAAHPAGTTVTVRNPGMPGGPSVVVDAATGRRVVTVIQPRFGPR